MNLNDFIKHNFKLIYLTLVNIFRAITAVCTLVLRRTHILEYKASILRLGVLAFSLKGT